MEILINECVFFFLFGTVKFKYIVCECFIFVARAWFCCIYYTMLLVLSIHLLSISSFYNAAGTLHLLSLER